MENKCNKTPNSNNNNTTTNSKYMDHVYCHTNQTKNSYNIMTTPGSIGGGAGGGAAASPNADVLALLKENKQLKAMLILHLDLIQEQSDQLMAKEKFLITRTEELELMRTRNVALENQVKELQKQLQQQIKRSGEVSTLPPPPLAKIQCKTQQSTITMAPLTPVQANCAKIITTTGTAKSNIIGECNGKLISKIVLQRVNSLTSGRGKHNQSPQSQTTDTDNEEDGDDEEAEDDDDHEEGEEEDEVDNEIDDADEDDGIEDEDEIEDENQQEENPCHEEEDPRHRDDEDNEIEEVEHSQDSQDDKSNTQPVAIDDLYDTGNTTEDSNEVLAVQSKRLRLRQAAKQSLAIPRGAKPSVSPASTTTNEGQTAFKAVTSTATSNTTHISKQPPTPSRGKQMTIMRWHAPDYNTDESVSCDSTAENERRSTSTTSSPLKPSPNVQDKKQSHDSATQHTQHRTKIRRCTYISTPQLYSTREWEDEAFNCDYDYEFFKAEAKILQADNPKLEIPKWTEHELTPSYCIEGTEDLSDEIFLKRHAKLEVDEKRRKKWDVQQIREQRRIERLKRRHCKDEIQPTQETPSLQTFYPTTENLQTICFVHDLPVQAFGEMIPKLTQTSANNGAKSERRKSFQLPWLDKEQLQFFNDNNKTPTVAIVNTSETTLTASLQMQQQMLNSSFTFLKKRRRQQSSSFGHNQYHNPRQRNQNNKLANNPITITANSNINSTPTFLNIVNTNIASTSLTQTTTTSSSLTPLTSCTINTTTPVVVPSATVNSNNTINISP